MVSIIIPTFNYGRYLTETLNSVRDQIFQDWECIVVDDGSVDNTHEIVAAFILTDNRYKYIYQNNKGVSSARNLGISTSIGEFVQFLDGDDQLQPDKIKSQVGVFTKNPSVDIVYNDVRFFDDENSQQLRRSLNDNKPDDWLPKFSGKGNMVVAHFCKINFLVMNSPLVKKNIFDKVGY